MVGKIGCRCLDMDSPKAISLLQLLAIVSLLVSECRKLMLSSFQEFLRAKGKRYTPEREAILNIIGTFEGHFTPEDVAQSLSGGPVTMSVVTVYRNLPVFVDAGILRRTCLSARESRYELALGREHHDHLICSHCGEVTEFQYEAIEILQEAVAAHHGFTIERHHLELVGMCAACTKTQPVSKALSERNHLQ